MEKANQADSGIYEEKKGEAASVLGSPSHKSFLAILVGLGLAPSASLRSGQDRNPHHHYRLSPDFFLGLSSADSLDSETSKSRSSFNPRSGSLVDLSLGRFVRRFLLRVINGGFSFGTCLHCGGDSLSQGSSLLRGVSGTL
ncbi:hypothetical protein BVY02_00065 [bacterium J17]|nr:hypothetical protein BVY02_00065 [bacterium J17]